MRDVISTIRGRRLLATAAVLGLAALLGCSSSQQRGERGDGTTTEDLNEQIAAWNPKIPESSVSVNDAGASGSEAAGARQPGAVSAAVPDDEFEFDPFDDDGSLAESLERGRATHMKLRAEDFSEIDESLIGEATARALVQQYRVVDLDAPISRYVRAVGSLLAEQANRKEIPFRFIVIDDPLINAFAAPYGYIFISTGILAFLENEAELAFVLAHEIGHVEKKHGLESLARATPDLQKLAARQRLEALSDEPTPEFIADLEKTMDELSAKALAGKGQHQESESDVIGLEICRRVGYDTAAALSFFDRLGKTFGFVTGEVDLFLSHPHVEDRLADARRWIRRNGSGGQTMAERYLDRTGALRQ